jgi:hypothetical protein
MRKVDNETTEWNCQDYVLESLGDLVDEYIIGDDEDYQDGIREARKYFGPL